MEKESKKENNNASFGDKTMQIIVAVVWFIYYILDNDESLSTIYCKEDAVMKLNWNGFEINYYSWNPSFTQVI